MAHLRTTSAAMIGQTSISGFPLIVERTFNVHWLSLEYFISLLRTCSVATIHTYAQHLVDFVDQLEVDGRVVAHVNDQWLDDYKKSILGRVNSTGRMNSENYAAQVLRSVVHYCDWLEGRKYERNLCGETELHRVQIRKSHDGSISHPLVIDKSKDKRPSNSPRLDWIDAIKGFGPKRDDLSIRFELMVDWARTAGVRAHELCGLTIDRLPQRETAEKAVENGKNVYMVLTVTKGSIPKKIPVSPILIKRTWVYIDSHRAAVVKRFKLAARKKHLPYSEPREVFLSDKTGMAMSPRGLSNSIRGAFLAAVETGKLTIDERVWLHGLRHHFSTKLLRGLDKKGVKRPEAIARQATRHGSEAAMEPYLTDRFNDDFDGS